MSSVSSDSPEYSDDDFGEKLITSKSAGQASSTGRTRKRRVSKQRQPSASPSLGCLPAVRTEKPAAKGSRPPLSTTSDSDYSLGSAEPELLEIDLYRETDGVIVNALERTSDVASPTSPAGAAWLEMALAAVVDPVPEAVGPLPTTSPARSEDQHESLLDPVTGELIVELPMAIEDISDVEEFDPLGLFLSLIHI